jgi:hypothetical protein
MTSGNFFFITSAHLNRIGTEQKAIRFICRYFGALELSPLRQHVTPLKAVSIATYFLVIPQFFTALADCNGPVQFDSPHWVGTIDTSKIQEASGLAVSRRNPGVLWTHNDGSSGKIYAISTSAVLLGSFSLGKTVSDIEDIAVGPGPDSSTSYVYIGDIGSNDATRDKVRIDRAPEPAVDPAWASDPVSKNLPDEEVFDLKYPDGSYNAEALLIDSIRQELFIATKEPGKSRIYRVPLGNLVDGETADLEFVREIPFDVVSGGDISADGRLVALRNELNAFLWIKDPNQSAGDALGGQGNALPLVGEPEEPNGESLAFTPDSSGYYTISEGADQPLYFFPRLPGGSETVQFSALPQLTSQGWQIPVSGCPGANVTLFRSTDLADWQSLGTRQLTGAGDSFLDATGSTRCFYKLELAP